MRKNNLIKVLFIVVVLILSTSVIQVSAQYVGDPAPDFTLTDIDGNEFSLSDYSGMVVLLEFFGPLCTGCQREVAELKEVQERYGDSVIIISISHGTLENTKKYRDSYKITWIVGWDPDSEVFQLYEVTMVPTTFIIDQEGDIHFRHDDNTTAETLIRKLEELGLPEFPAAIVFPLFMIATLIAVFLGRKTWLR